MSSARNPHPLTSQVALITGGGSGIGLGCARELVRDGATVMLAARNVERLETSAAELRSIAEGGAQVLTVACDVTSEQSVTEACAAANSAGKFTMVVANAGYGGGTNPLDIA